MKKCNFIGNDRPSHLEKNCIYYYEIVESDIYSYHIYTHDSNPYSLIATFSKDYFFILFNNAELRKQKLIKINESYL